MANTVKIRNSSTAAAAPSSLEAGELAINTADAKLFWEDSAGSIQTTYLQPNLGDLADVSDTVPSPNTSVYVLANVPSVGWTSQGTIGSVSVGSEPLGGWPSGSVGELLDGKASTSHASTHATGGSDAISPADIGAAPAASPTFTGVITVSAGSAAAPAIVASGDSNTGIAFPSADTFAVSTAGVERLRIGAGGAVAVTDRLQVPRGSAATPSIQLGGYVGDYDTGMWSPAADTVSISTGGQERVRVSSAGNVGIYAASPTAKLDINADTIRLRTAKTPASSSDTGNAGDICWDSSYLYICTATDTWRRIAHSTW